LAEIYTDSKIPIALEINSADPLWGTLM